MASGSLPASRSFASRHDTGTASVAGLAWELLRAAGSLKITVVMFLAATFLLLVGTLAQDEKNLPEVKAEYFNSWLAKVPFADFLPVTIFGESNLPGWFPFPGGATIGFMLLLNLIAAKVTRFHVAATGKRLAWGTIVSLVGGLADHRRDPHRPPHRRPPGAAAGGLRDRVADGAGGRRGARRRGSPPPRWRSRRRLRGGEPVGGGGRRGARSSG